MPIESISSLDRLGKYEIRGTLGRGVHGTTYLALDPASNRQIVIKAVPVASPADIPAWEEWAKRISQLQHPRIVPILEWFSGSGHFCLVSEFVPGRFDAALQAADLADLPSHLRLLNEIANALDAAHELGILHGSLHPANVLLDEEGLPRLTDFGWPVVPPKLNGEQVVPVEEMASRWAYLAPEQLQPRALDGRADQYSLAVLAFQLLTGRHPLQAGDWPLLAQAIATEAPLPPSHFSPRLKPHIDKAFARAFAKDPAERFFSCAEFVDGLREKPLKKEEDQSSTFRKILVLAPLALIVSLVCLAMIKRTQGRLDEGLPGVPDRDAAPPVRESLADRTPMNLAAPSTTDPGGDSLSLVLDGSPLLFARIPAGQFQLGNPQGALDEQPAKTVSLTQTFQLSRTEVTEREWNAVMGGKAHGASLPKTNVNWNDIQEFLKRLSALDSSFQYRLPTEAEWEYAARSGLLYPTPQRVTDEAWTAENSEGSVKEVASKIKNPFGLYDMLGNAAEWTSDWYSARAYNDGPAVDPKGPGTGTQRVVRGGSFLSNARSLTFTARSSALPEDRLPDVGFRLVRTPKQK